MFNLQSVYQEVLNINDNDLSFSDYYIIDVSGMKHTLDTLEFDLDSFDDFCYSFTTILYWYGCTAIYNVSNDDVISNTSIDVEGSETFYLGCY